MYMDFKVRIPDKSSGITKKTIKGATYIYYVYSHKYDPGKRYSVTKNTSIGKQDRDDPEMMYPNQSFFRYFPDAEIPSEKTVPKRSYCLRIGAFIVIRKIIADRKLDALIDGVLPADGGLFLDLAAYSIITENNAGQYYPDYAFNHPLFTDGMKVYSDTKVSDFINTITKDQCIVFQNAWNSTHDHREKIYISYDSTNKNCQAGDLELVEIGHPKDNRDKPILNFSIAYDHNNSEPLFYEEYPGSIVDVAQLQLMLEKARSYGYHSAGFILDRGYFSKENIHYMDKCGYEFVLMMKGMRSLVKDLVLEVKGTFEDKYENQIRGWNVSGITVDRQLYPSDEKERHFHIYYNDGRKGAEKSKILQKFNHLNAIFEERQGTAFHVPDSFSKYYDIVYYHKGRKDEVFQCARPRYDVIDEDISLCGYFVIITSEKMTAGEALDLYKSRDASEKLFRSDKTYLGYRSLRVHSDEAIQGKTMIEFAALIIRNRMHLLLKNRMLENPSRHNYLTVPAAIRELEKIEIIRQPDGNYRLNYAVTATQKEILKAFGMTETNIRKQAAEINSLLIETTIAEKEAQS